jgi:hypothetical protein
MGQQPKKKYEPEGKTKKTLWFNTKRLEGCEPMLEEGQRMATFIQDNVGRFGELVAELKDMKWQLEQREILMKDIENPPEGYPFTLYARQLQIDKLLEKVEWIKYPETGGALKK